MPRASYVRILTGRTSTRGLPRSCRRRRGRCRRSHRDAPRGNGPRRPCGTWGARSNAPVRELGHGQNDLGPVVTVSWMAGRTCPCFPIWTTPVIVNLDAPAALFRGAAAASISRGARLRAGAAHPSGRCASRNAYALWARGCQALFRRSSEVGVRCDRCGAIVASAN